MEVKVLVADDHPLVREGLRRILSLDPSICLVGEAADGKEAVELACRTHPDVVLMDVNMPGMNGIEACRAIKEKLPEVKVVALTIHDQVEYVLEFIRAGASAYLLKDVSPDQLLATIRGVMRGESHLSPRLAPAVFDAVRSPGGPRVPLTRRELEVLRLLVQGESNRGIAQKLFISEKTVKNHLTSIFQKLGVADRTQAVLYAIKHRLVEF